MSDSLWPPWTVAHQAPPSMGFSRQEYWSGLPFPSLGDLPNPGIEPRYLALQADALTSEPPVKPKFMLANIKTWRLVSKTSHKLQNIFIMCVSEQELPRYINCSFRLVIKVQTTWFFEWAKDLMWSHSVVSDSLQPHGLCSPPGSSVHGIFQARILEWVAISFSRGSSQPRDGTRVLHIAGFTIWAPREAVKCLPPVLETRVPSLGLEDPLEKGMATHSGILAPSPQEGAQRKT